ncbi:hypothetical protein Tco_0684130 [Tanacetum coccineum]
MAAPTIPVSVDSFEGSSKDMIDIGVDERLLDMPTQRWEEIEEELMALRERERANRAETEGVTCALELDHWRLLRHGFMA